ncbi:type VI secretion system protein TssA [Pandoraea sp. NPDC090278]|uniref:type VI secretion system protein TssA n=1 Tax=Pandoraea sp. NPDC090278 TaxID=3364391 RepID=UPI00383AC3CB
MMLAGLLNRLFPAIRHAEKFARARLDAWSDWLTPLPDRSGNENGAGRDPAYEELFFTVKDEAGKLSEIDDNAITHHCEHLIKVVGKDLRLAGYYATARLRRDGIAGFSDGLELAAALVDRFSDAVLPTRAQARCGALDMLSTPRVLEQLAACGPITREDLERTMAALDVLLAHASTWPETSRPNLQALVSHFERTVSAAGATADNTSEATKASPVAASIEPVKTAHDVLAQARVMARWLRSQEHGYLSAARLVRSVRWDTLQDLPPTDVTGKSRLAAPRAELRQHLKRLMLQKQWPELLERVEEAFVELANHFWLDLQYFQHVALGHSGAPHSAWADLLRTDIALFLQRLPGIERLTFDDGIPFADDVTREWLAQHAVVHDLAAGESLASFPVFAEVLSDTTDSVGGWREIETQSREKLANEGLEAAFAWIEALPGMTSHRHRFLQRLVMARVAEKAGRSDTAIALFSELDSATRSFVLTQWEPTLAFDIKQQLAQALKASSTRKDIDKMALTRRIADLRADMTVLDPIRSLTSQ